MLISNIPQSVLPQMPPRLLAAPFPPKYVSQLIHYLAAFATWSLVNTLICSMYRCCLPCILLWIPSVSLGVLQSVQLLTSGCTEVPSLHQSQLTGNGTLEGAVMIKSNDGNLIGLRTWFLPCVMAMKTASHAYGKQATQEQQPTDHHNQPGKGEDTGLRQKDFIWREPLNVFPCIKRG